MNCDLKPRPHLYANAEWGMRKWEKCWCGHVTKVNSIRLYGKHLVNSRMLLFRVGTSNKNTFAILGIHLARQMPNKPLFGIRSDSPQPRSHMPHICIRAQMWIYLNIPQGEKSRILWRTRAVKMMALHFQKYLWFHLLPTNKDSHELSRTEYLQS